MMGLLQSIEGSGFSQWVKQSGSLWAFPGILLAYRLVVWLLKLRPRAAAKLPVAMAQ